MKNQKSRENRFAKEIFLVAGRSLFLGITLLFSNKKTKTDVLF